MSALAPPELERLLWLVPPLVREEIAGDLAERYRSPASWLLELARLLPWVVWSQVRRASDPALFLLVAFTLVASLGGLEPNRGPDGVPVPLRALAATFGCMTVLLLRNAYRREEGWNGRRAAGDVAWLAIALLLSQIVIGLIAPGWNLPLGWVVGGYVYTSIVMVLLRSGIELANTGHRPGLGAMPDPGEDYRRFHRNLRLRRAIETGALALPAIIAAWFALTADRPVVSLIAGAWAAVTLLLVANRWVHKHGRAFPAKFPSKESLAHYIAELERQRAAKALAWWWYFAPLFAGIAFNTIAFGVVAQRPLATITGVAACAALAVMIARVAARRKQRIAEKIAQLERSSRSLPAYR